MRLKSTTNPYESPSSASQSVSPSSTPNSGCDFGGIILRWERLRLSYNAFLTSVVLLLTVFVFPVHLADFGYWIAVLIGAFIANLCFFTGPAIEGYGTHFRCWHGAFTIILFLAGLALATLLAIACVVSYPTS